MRRTLLVLVPLLVVVVIATGLIAVWPRGVRVTLTNLGPQPLTEVVVHVTGNSYRLETLSVGESRTVSVQARGESHIVIEFTCHSGERIRLNAGGYFEGSGYEGTVEIDLEACKIVRNDHQIRLWPSWL